MTTKPCEKCGEILKHREKFAHIAIKHPEYAFTVVSSHTKYGGRMTKLKCGICLSLQSSYKDMFAHYDRLHHEHIFAHLLQTSEPDKHVLAVDEFMASIADKFTAALSSKEKKITELTGEVAKWEQIAKRWSERCVEMEQAIVNIGR